MPEPCIFIVILNTNRKEDTLEALRSIYANDYQNFQVIVLDNQSSDGSVEAIGKAYPQVQLISLEKNSGYAGNNNVGIEAAMAQGADWVFVLNEDTILEAGCLRQLVEGGEALEHTGIVGPMVFHHNEPEVIQSAGVFLDGFWRSIHVGQNEPDQGQYSDLHEVDAISGCAILVRRQVIEQVGGLDERFFYYWEETDWCLRAKEAGWRVVFVPKAKLWHKGVQRDYKPSLSVSYYNTRNRFFLMSKHKAPLKPWAFGWFETIRTLISMSLRPKWRERLEHRDAMFQGLKDYLGGRMGKREI